MEEVATADGRELAVPEEAGEREGAQVLPNQRDVVVGNTVQSLPTPGAVEVATERWAPPVESARHTGQRELEILARRIRVAELELDGLADAHGVADGDGAGGLVRPDQIAHQEIPALERRFRRIDGQAGEDAGALSALRPARGRRHRVTQHGHGRTASDLEHDVTVGPRDDVRLTDGCASLSHANDRPSAREGDAGQRAARRIGRVELERRVAGGERAHDRYGPQ